MSNQVIVIKNEDGSCGILTPAPNAMQGEGAMTIEKIAAKDVPNGKSHRICTTVDLPADRSFRNAWTDDNPTQTVDVDMTKARPIHMENIRKVRNGKLEELDKAYIRADEAGDMALKANIAMQKQTLRDIPQMFDLTSAGTPEELKALWPVELV